MNIDWKRKLTSRKFWAAVVGFVTPPSAGLWRGRSVRYPGDWYHHGWRHFGGVHYR